MRCLQLSAPVCLLDPAHSTQEVTETLADFQDRDPEAGRQLPAHKGSSRHHHHTACVPQLTHTPSALGGSSFSPPAHAAKKKGVESGSREPRVTGPEREQW